jgi:hypothetical protein
MNLRRNGMTPGTLSPRAQSLYEYLEGWRRARWSLDDLYWLAHPDAVARLAEEFRSDPQFEVLGLSTVLGAVEVQAIADALATMYPFPQGLLGLEAALVKEALTVLATERGAQRTRDLVVLTCVGVLALAFFLPHRST